MKKQKIMTVGKCKDLSEHLKSALGTKFKCDECKDTFLGKDIELKPYGDRMDMINPMLSFKFFQEPGGTIIGTSNTTILPKDKVHYTLHCPKCHNVHLFGMDVAK
jgi:hypothetical protein